MSLHRLLGFTAGVPDPEAVAGYYTEMGLIGDPTAGFAGSDGGTAIRLAESDVRQLHRVEVGCESEADLVAIASRLSDGEANVTITDGMVVVVDDATKVEFAVLVVPAAPAPAPAELAPVNAPGATVRPNRRAPAVFQAARAPRRLGHMVIGTPSIGATRDLLVQGLGFKVSDEVEGIITFLRCSTDHHNVALVESPVPLLQHYSFECDDIDHAGHSATKLLRGDADRHTWGMGRHFVGSNFYWYLRDPAGSYVEFYADMDQITDDETWDSVGRTTFDLEHVANAWGPEIPLEFIVPPDLAVLEAAWRR